MLLHGPGTVEWLEPPAGPALGLNGYDWPLNELELPDGTRLLVLLTDGLFEGHSGRGRRAPRRGRACSSWRVPLRHLPGPAFVDALIDGAERTRQAHGGLTDDIAVVRVERTHVSRADAGARGSQLTRAGLAEPGAVGHGSWLVLAGAVAAAVLLNRTDEVSTELIDDIQPARVAAYRLQAALRDQETAVRGYVISADRQFLEPYYDGQRAEIAAADEIRQRVGDRPELIADLDAIERAAAAWRAHYAEPLIASVTPGSPRRWYRAPSAARPNSTDPRAFRRQNEHLTAARPTASPTSTDRAWRDRVLAAIVVTF